MRWRVSVAVTATVAAGAVVATQGGTVRRTGKVTPVRTLSASGVSGGGPAAGLRESARVAQRRLNGGGGPPMQFVRESPLDGEARPLGALKELYIVVQITGRNGAVQVQAVTVGDAGHGALERAQLSYDEGVCVAFAGIGAGAFCGKWTRYALYGPSGSHAAAKRFGDAVVEVKSRDGADGQAPPVVYVRLF